MSITSYIEDRYQDTFAATYAELSAMADHDPVQAERYMRGILKDLYIRQGNDWTGRGAIGNAGLDASVAAYESVLAELSPSALARQCG